MTETSEFLALVVDINPQLWSAAQSQHYSSAADFTHFLNHVEAFVGMFLSLSSKNRLVLFTTFGPNGTKFVADSAFLEPIATDEIENLVAGGMLETIATIVTRLSKTIREAYANENAADQASRAWCEGFNLSGAVGRALCYLNKHSLLTNDTVAMRKLKDQTIRNISAAQTEAQFLEGRILILKTTKENQKQYIDAMNTIFAAQKMAVPVDICNLGPSESVLLQQGADLTGGTYLFLKHPTIPLLPHLIWTFLAPVKLRGSKLMMSKQAIVSSMNADCNNTQVVDYRPSCFCHRRLIEVGYVCSTCMSVFCTFTPVCRTCMTTFKIKTGKN